MHFVLKEIKSERAERNANKLQPPTPGRTAMVTIAVMSVADIVTTGSEGFCGSFDRCFTVQVTGCVGMTIYVHCTASPLQ